MPSVRIRRMASPTGVWGATATGLRVIQSPTVPMRSPHPLMVTPVRGSLPVSPRGLWAIRYQHHRDRRGALDGLGHAAPDRPIQAAPAMAGHGDEIGPRGLRVLDDLLRGIAEGDRDLDLDSGQGLGGLLEVGEPCELDARGLLVRVG